MCSRGQGAGLEVTLSRRPPPLPARPASFLLCPTMHCCAPAPGDPGHLISGRARSPLPGKTAAAWNKEAAPPRPCLPGCTLAACKAAHPHAGPGPPRCGLHTDCAGTARPPHGRDPRPQARPLGCFPGRAGARWAGAINHRRRAGWGRGGAAAGPRETAAHPPVDARPPGRTQPAQARGAGQSRGPGRDGLPAGPRPGRKHSRPPRAASGPRGGPRSCGPALRLRGGVGARDGSPFLGGTGPPGHAVTQESVCEEVAARWASWRKRQPTPEGRVSVNQAEEDGRVCSRQRGQGGQRPGGARGPSAALNGGHCEPGVGAGRRGAALPAVRPSVHPSSLGGRSLHCRLPSPGLPLLGWAGRTAPRAPPRARARALPGALAGSRVGSGAAGPGAAGPASRRPSAPPTSRPPADPQPPPAARCRRPYCSQQSLPCLPKLYFIRVRVTEGTGRERSPSAGSLPKWPPRPGWARSRAPSGSRAGAAPGPSRLLSQG